MEDREIVAAIAAGDPDGIAAAYDTYAKSVYGYCRRMLREPAEAAGAVQDTFVLATTALTDPGFLRSWFFATARGECLRRPSLIRGGSIGAAGDAAVSTAEVEGAGGPAGAGEDERAELRALIPATLAEFEPEEREAVVLSLWHDLDDADLAAVFGVSRPEAYAMASGGRTQLEKALSTLRIARSGRAECPELGALLADWDGRLTIDTLHLADRHTEQCQTCAAGRRGKLRPEVLARLLPPPALPAGLREQVLELCAGTAPEAIAYREQVRAEAQSPARFLPEAGAAGPGDAGSYGAGSYGAGSYGAGPVGAGPVGAGRAVAASLGGAAGAAALAGWSKTRGHPRVAAAVVVIAVVAAISVPVMAAGSAHVPRTLIPQAGTGTFSSAGAPVPAGGQASAGTGTGSSPSPSPQPTAAARLTPSTWSPPQPSPTKSARPSKSASPKPSPSSSSPSPSPPPSSPSPTPTRTKPASPPPTPTPTGTTTTSTPSPTATST